MASPSILRSPVHALLKSSSTRSILKRPAPIPLSPKRLPLATSFSIVINSPHPSPHVHFPLSPAIAATFTAYSPNTYDRGPITISPESPGLSGWASRQLSPSTQNAFKLLAPPDKRKAQPQDSQMLTVPAFEDPRSPKPYKDVYKTPAATQQTQLLSVPPIEDPRSPKSYKPRAGANFRELTLHAPRPRVLRGAEELGKALSTYPRSPYPSAPIEDDMDVDVGVDMNAHGSETPERGRWPTKSSRPHPQPPSRARSLENEPKTRGHSILAQAHYAALPLRQNFLSPVTESVSVSVKPKLKVKPTLTSLDFDIETQFWESVTLEGKQESAYITAIEFPVSTSANINVSLPDPDIMFGSKDGQLWSPEVSTRSQTKTLDHCRGAAIGSLNLLSPAQRQKKVFSKGMVASPSPRDPSAAFLSFRMDGHVNVAYPPPVRVIRGMGGAEARARARNVLD